MQDLIGANGRGKTQRSTVPVLISLVSKDIETVYRGGKKGGAGNI